MSIQRLLIMVAAALALFGHRLHVNGSPGLLALQFFRSLGLRSPSLTHFYHQQVLTHR